MNVYTENLSAANSRIRDTDMAEEVSELTKQEHPDSGDNLGFESGQSEPDGCPKASRLIRRAVTEIRSRRIMRTPSFFAPHPVGCRVFIEMQGFLDDPNAWTALP